MTRRRAVRPRAAWLGALLALALLSGVVVGMTPLPAAAVGAPILIDDFSGHFRGDRKVTPLPEPGTSTNPTATFTESGGLGTMQAVGTGNALGGVQLDYSFPSTDLTDGGSNTQFYVEFASIQRTPEVVGENSVSFTISVTDTNGTTGVYNTGFGNAGDFDLVMNFSCAG